MRIFLMIFILLFTGAKFASAASYEWNWCEGARDAKACLVKCKLEDVTCQADWLDNDSEIAKKLLETALSSDEGYQEICKKLILPLQIKICGLCPQKTRECALMVLEREVNYFADRARSRRELNRISELKASPGYTNDSLKKFDPRKPIDRRRHPEYNPIGVVSLPSSISSIFNRGTGWLTSDCLVVTARHVITGTSYNEKELVPPLGKRVKFLVGVPPTEDMNFAYKSEGTVVAAGENGRRISEDWALIKLDQPLGKHVGQIKTWQYSVEDALTCVSLDIAGYPGGKDVDRLWGQKDCPLEKYVSSKWQFIVGCPATPGNSGGPLLCRETDGDLRAIGVVATQSYGANAQALNFTGDWFEKINPAFLAHKNSCPK